MSVRILTGDCRDVLKTLPDNSVDAIVTDPPYELTSARPGGRSEATRGKVMGGFMGMKWDGTGVAFDAAMWREALRVLKPGGLLVAFGGTRTYHRLVCAIEDGGFEVRDMLAWLYGSGFPKGTDKAKIPEAWKGWNTALKPAIEPICLGRKPMEGTLAENLAKWGTGAMWIDGCRVDMSEEDPAYIGDRIGGFNSTKSIGGNGAYSGGQTMDRAAAYDASKGRWPANVLHDGSDEVLAAFPEAPGQIADASASASASARKTQHVYGAMRRGRGDEASANSENHGAVGFKMRPGARRLDAGSAARFFYCAKASRRDRNEGLEDPGPQFKSGSTLRDAENLNASGASRGNTHPTVKPIELMRYLCRLVTPPGGTVLDLFTGSGSTLKAAELEGFSAIGIELDPEYIEIARRRIAGDAPLFSDVEVAA